MSVNIIAIDGPAASGKSTIAKKLAERMNAVFVSTGAMYRALAWKALKLYPENEITPEKIIALLPDTDIVYDKGDASGEAQVKIDGAFPGEELRSDEVTRLVSRVATIPEVRTYMVKRQRELADTAMLVMEGRDIGTEVFPDAKYKFFLTASAKVRALRRLAQEGKTLDPETVASVTKAIEDRDHQDMNRKVSPLRKADDAFLVDNSDLSIEETLNFIIDHIKKGSSPWE